MANLNKEQKRAIETTEGPVLILAGAGSGKTRVLVHRISYLIKNKMISPSKILGLTFTNKAAEEMRSRVASILTPAAAKEVMLSTFHSFCMKILRKEIDCLGYTARFSLYDERDMRRIITQLAEEVSKESGVDPCIETIVSSIAYAKSKGLQSDHLPTLSSIEETNCFKNVYEKLKISMRAYNALDFDSLLTLTVELFEKFPNILSKYQEQYRYIMIDEYQDTSPIQYKLASLLSAKHQNLCVVGDDDQSIYAWRGAEIKHILNFPAKTTIKLEENYRSTSHILKAANAVIQHNKTRHNKELRANQGKGETVEIFNAPTEVEEVEAVISRLLQLKERKRLKWNEIAILYRSNQIAKLFEISLMQTVWKNEKEFIRGIPYQVFGGTPFFERSEVKDLMAYLRIIANPKDQEALLRIINYPRRGISDKTLDQLTQFNRTKKIPLMSVLQGIADQTYPELKESLTPKGKQGIDQFIQLFETATETFIKKPLHEAFKWLIETIDYKKAIFDEVKSEKAREFKWQNVQICLEAIFQHQQSENPFLEEFLASTLLNSQSTKKNKGIDNRLNLMTFHSAKGLEFKSVFLVGIEDHLVPHEKSQTRDGIEEERRLLYVAITRAMEDLCISMARKRTRFGTLKNSNPSRFLFEIPKDIVKVSSWK